MNHTFTHVHGHIGGAFRPRLVPTGQPIETAPPSAGPAVGDGILLEDGTSFLLLESGDYLLLE